MRFFPIRRAKTRPQEEIGQDAGPEEAEEAAPVRHEAALVPAAPEHVHPQYLAAELLRAAEPATPDGLRVNSPVWGRALEEDIQRVVVAPSTARGAADAAAMITTWRRDLPRPVLLVVRDGPLPPPELATRRFRSVAGRCALSLEVPYLEQVRLFEEPAQALQAKGRTVRRVYRRLQQVRLQLYTAAAFLTYLEPVGVPEPLDLPAASVCVCGARQSDAVATPVSP